MFFSGTPLISDPGSFLFYLPNIIFLVLPIDYAFIASFILHTFFGGLGTYLVAKKGLRFSKTSSIFTAIFYITFPRTAGFLETGHFPFVATTAWMPYLLLAAIKLIKFPNFKWSILLAISLSGLFFTFATTFVTAAASTVLFVGGSYFFSKNRSLKTLIFLGFGIAITIGLTAITLFPQLEWLPQTTRFILLQDRDVYPKWNGKTEFIKAIYPHVFGGKNLINDLDSEKWIAIGFFISILALIGFLKLQNKFKILLILFVSGIFLISLNNVSPIQPLLLSSDWYVLSRVSTRNWFIVILSLVFLAGSGFETLQKKKLKRLAGVLAALTIGELLILSWIRLERPIPHQREKVPVALYEFLKKDPERFRVFCVNRCLSQQDVAKYNLETIEGYGTIYQKNYYNQFIQLSQVFWDKYTSMLPPPSIYNFREIQPIASILADHNVKYVISPHKLTGIDFKLVKQFDKFFVFENTLFKSRAYFVAKGNKSEIEAPILYYSPNKIIIDTSKHKAKEMVLAETWSPGWKAKTNDGKKIRVVETTNKLIKVTFGNEIQSVELYYYPESYQLGRTISIFTLLTILSYSLWISRRQKSFKRTRQ
ncbi:MAG: hypothetical protein HYU80_02210 [Candidatus Blackburnbacteria bacterium]|nr:hypothetical protein [Candidatus Blackburnbacteria bacterium]